jgi:hypothetical protein
MTEDRLPLAELLQKAGDGDFLRVVAEAVLQILPPGPAGPGSSGDRMNGLLAIHGDRRGRPDRGWAARAFAGAADLAQRLSGPCIRHPAGHPAAPRAQAPAGQPRSALRLKSRHSSSPGR